MQAYSFNEKAQYKAGWQGKVTKPDIYTPATNSIVYTEDEGKWLKHALAKSPTIFVSPSDSFMSSPYQDIFQDYLIHIDSDEDADRWNNNVYKEDNSSMKFYQNQLNFAIWCATTGCGISVRDHLIGGNGLSQSVFRFHVYYQARKILLQMEVPLPNNKAFNPNNNANINMDKYAAICNEFKISKDTDWRFKLGYSLGMGTIYTYAANWGENNHYMPIPGDYSRKDHTFGTPNKTTKYDVLRGVDIITQDRTHIEYSQQDSKYENGWIYFITERSDGFTEAGVNRLNDSIRTYAWAILTAQSQTKQSIVRTLQNPATEPQREFLSNLEISIVKNLDLQTSINSYQDSLKFARSKVDYVVGFGLYMIPSNMLLRITTIDDYNNNLLVASPDRIKNLKLGTNEDVNKKEDKKTDLNIPDKLSPAPVKQEVKKVQDESSKTLNKEETNLLIYLAFAVGVGGLYLYKHSKSRS